MNKDGDAVEAESFKPPPKMGNVMGNNHQPLQAPQLVAQMPQMNQYSQPQAIPQAMTQPQNPISPMDNVNPALVQQHQMPAAVPEGAPAAAAPNMFKMQKGRSKSSISRAQPHQLHKISHFRFEEVVRGHFRKLWSNCFATEGAGTANGYAVLQPGTTTAAGMNIYKSFKQKAFVYLERILMSFT